MLFAEKRLGQVSLKHVFRMIAEICFNFHMKHLFFLLPLFLLISATDLSWHSFLFDATVNHHQRISPRIQPTPSRIVCDVASNSNEYPLGTGGICILGTFPRHFMYLPIHSRHFQTVNEFASFLTENRGSQCGRVEFHMKRSGVYVDLLDNLSNRRSCVYDSSIPKYKNVGLMLVAAMMKLSEMYGLDGNVMLLPGSQGVVPVYEKMGFIRNAWFPKYVEGVDGWTWSYEMKLSKTGKNAFRESFRNRTIVFLGQTQAAKNTQ